MRRTPGPLIITNNKEGEVVSGVMGPDGKIIEQPPIVDDRGNPTGYTQPSTTTILDDKGNVVPLSGKEYY